MLVSKWKTAWLLTGLLAVSGIGVEAFSGSGAAAQTEETKTAEAEASEETMAAGYEQLIEKEAELKERLREKEIALESGQASQTEVMDLQEAVREVQLCQIAWRAGYGKN